LRILIIGGTGFIGSWVTRHLFARNHDLLLFQRKRAGHDIFAEIKSITGDRSNMADFCEEFREFAPEVVLDMIPLRETDAVGVMDTFRGIARRVVTVSSQDVYGAYGKFTGTETGPPENFPAGEDSPLRKNLYPYRGMGMGLDDYDKITVERVVMGDPEISGTVLRLPMVYGPGDRQHRLFNFLKPMDDGRPAVLLQEGLHSWRWTRGYVENVALSIAMAVTEEKAAGQIYNVGEER